MRVQDIRRGGLYASGSKCWRLVDRIEDGFVHHFAIEPENLRASSGNSAMCGDRSFSQWAEREVDLPDADWKAVLESLRQAKSAFAQELSAIRAEVFERASLVQGVATDMQPATLEGQLQESSAAARVCIECGKPTENPRFCDRSCSAKFNNRVHPKRGPEGRCATCGTAIPAREKHCETCSKLEHDRKSREAANVKQWIDPTGRLVEEPVARVRVDSKLVFAAVKRFQITEGSTT